MSRGEEVAKLLIESGYEWTCVELAKHFGCTHNSIQSAMTTVNRLCTLVITTGKSSLGRPELRYRAVVCYGVGILAMNKPTIKHKPAVVHAPGL